MTKIGKAMTVLIFVMSISYLGFAAAVQMAHQDWDQIRTRPRDQAGPGRPPGLKYQLEDTKKEAETLQAEIDRLKQEYTVELEATRQELAKAEQYRLDLDLQLSQMYQQADQLTQQLEDAVAEFQVVQEEEANLRGVVEGLQADIATTQTSRDDNLASTVQLTDQLNQAMGKWRQVKARHDLLAAQIDRFKQQMAETEVKSKPAPMGPQQR